MADHKANTGRLTLNNTAYDFAKQAALIWLPGLGALYAGLAAIWGLPNAVEVVGTITAVDTFLGLVLGISTASYNNGKTDNPDNQKLPEVTEEPSQD